MVLIYSLMDRSVIFTKDAVFTKKMNNARETYKYQKWEEFGYLDYVPFSDYMLNLAKNGEVDEETRVAALKLANTPDKDDEIPAKYAQQFTDYYTSKGYKITRLDAIPLSKRNPRKLANGGQPALFAAKDKPLTTRVINYFSGILKVDNIHRVEEGIVGKRGLTFTLYDPMYGGEKFSPAIMGNGTQNKYLLYFDSKFPYIHQNFVTLRLGTSYVVNQGFDVVTTMTQSQGSYVTSTITYPTGLTEVSADDLHTASFMPGSLNLNLVYKDRFVDDYTNTRMVLGGMSKMGFSFSIGILSVLLAYSLGVPLGLLMARKKDKLVDKIGTLYIVFIIAVPSLSYIFLFKAVGGAMGLPTTFNVDSSSKTMYILPVVSLALPSIANLMKWMRRYMIDQMNSDYVKFARSGGLTEGEIFSKHILKNAIIPLVHGIPGSILGCLVGAIITERVYSVPGTGNLLTTAINAYDNSVIVGVTMFYALLSVVSVIMGDVLMSMVDPRISFSSKAR